MTNHTPGPWKLGKTLSTIVSDSALGIDMLGATDKSAVEHYGGNLIAESVSANNTALIAAAPEMLETLTVVYLVLSRGVFDQELLSNVARMARMTIEKATGEEDGDDD